MQSGISASQELLNAFKTFVAADDQRALLVGIADEQLVPTHTVPLAAAAFNDDLAQLQPLLSPTAAAYILLKTEAGAANGCVAVTYVPNAAPVRQKMLFAATRLTLVRELGTERFRGTLFATEADEFTAAGWARHEQHEALAAPLTDAEAGLAGLREAEVTESQGTGTRRGHVGGRVDVPTGDGVVEALASVMEEGCAGTLVQLKYALPDETLLLDSSTDSVAPEQVAALISATEPRYAFYSHPVRVGPTPNILFIYTCPTASRIKERMVYSTSKSWTRIVAERDAGVIVTRSLEATEPSDLTVEILGEEEKTAETSAAEANSSGFARPKRPGRR